MKNVWNYGQNKKKSIEKAVNQINAASKNLQRRRKVQYLQIKIDLKILGKYRGVYL